MIKEAGKGLIVVVSKWDSVDKDAYTRDALAKTISREFPFIAWAPLIFTSAVSGQNVSKIFEIAHDIDQRRAINIPTKQLNNWLASCVRHHPPAGLKNSHPKFNYMVQDGTKPPSFRIYGRDVRLTHWSYRRYLEKMLRESYELGGTPIEIYFIDNSRGKLKEPELETAQENQ
jgi:GTP-binding protein